MQSHRIERLDVPATDADIRSLAELLVEAVESGSAVSFLSPLTMAQAEQWWRRAMANSPSGVVFLVARDPDGVTGTVQLQPAWAPNQPHRADVVKLLVRRRCRREGVATRLMEAIEAEARRAGFTLLTLDTRRGDAAERLYVRSGWHPVGTIPGYALDPDGTPHDAVLFFKRLQPAAT